MKSRRAVLLLRGINVGPRKRIAMPRLRELLAERGYEDVSTYVQSGNVVVSSGLKPAALEADCEQLIAAQFGLEVPVLVRSATEMAAAVAHNPLRDVVEDPKRYQVTFLRSRLPASQLTQVAELARGGERLVAHGREIYSWHPDGAARSKLWAKLASASLGAVATSRNWTTVTRLADMAAES